MKTNALSSPFSRPIYLGAATRTPIGKFGGSLSRIPAPKLAALCLQAALSRAPDVPAADFVLLGHARQAGAGPNPARQAAVFAGLPESTPAFTINQACASGMTAIISAVEKIAIGRAHSIWAGGVESMSNTPYLLMNARFGMRLGHGEAVDGMHKDGFHCALADMVMGKTVEEFIAKERGISRRAQDEYALLSQQRAEAAWQSGAFRPETFAIAPDPKDRGQPGLAQDEHRRPQTSLEELAKLPAVFDPKQGSVTAGNSSGITDGAAFLHVSDRKDVHAQAEILDYETVALDPKRMGLGPIGAIGKILARQRVQIDDLHAIEINEAFAAQILACQTELKIPTEKLNPRGGAIALGHPIGASGARVTTTLIHQLAGNSGSLGIASLCVSGGQGIALLLRGL
ncbi:MAG: acetyl-CoA C-acyltransferase [Bacteriovoracia bacterium]